MPPFLLIPSSKYLLPIQQHFYRSLLLKHLKLKCINIFHLPIFLRYLNINTKEILHSYTAPLMGFLFRADIPEVLFE